MMNIYPAVGFFALCVGLPRAVVPLLVIANFLAVYRVVYASKDGVTVSTYALLESVVALLIVSANLADLPTNVLVV